MPRYPFTAVVGAHDLALALVLTSISPHIGGVLVRGEKGTAKSTIVRGLVDVLPPIEVVHGCRFACDPLAPSPDCPDGPHTDATAQTRQTKLVELPVGASDDRVTGSMDLAKALGAGHAEFRPGLLAEANRGLLYVDEVNLLHDHLVDLLLDASAMGRNTVERDGMSVTHDARFVLVGTMNPEEGELRPQLLDRFGLSVDVAASREPQTRAEVVTRRLAYDADPAGFAAQYAAAQAELTQHLAEARASLGTVTLTPWALRTIARVCAGFDVDGMRADIVIARAASAHAAWNRRERIERDDIRAAARFALAHRRRRGPFDPPGLDESLLDRLLDEEPEPPTPPDDPNDPDDGPEGGPNGGSDGGSGAQDDGDSPEPGNDTGGADSRTEAGVDSTTSGPHTGGEEPTLSPQSSDDNPTTSGAPGDAASAPTGVAAASARTYRPRRLEARGLGQGAVGRRSAAETSRGRVIGVHHEPTGTLHLPATILTAARRGDSTVGSRLTITPGDLRHARLRGRESNLVMFCVDASGSMAARRRMEAVKTAVLSLLLDAYERRDKVGLVTFAGRDATLVLPPTSSVDRAATLLAEMPHGGRTPLAEGLTLAAQTVARERLRDPKRRPLVVIVTDGRATSGADALARAKAIADAWAITRMDTVVVDCESGRFRMRLAADLAHRMGATHVPLEEVSADGLLSALDDHRTDGKAA